MKAENVSNCNNALDTFCGSPPYAAPELFRDDCYLGPPVDIWAMGVLLFFMVTGTMPFRAETMGKLRRCIMECSYTVPPSVPGPCQRLIKGILKAAPSERYSRTPCIYIHTHTHTYIYIHIYIHIYTHTRTYITSWSI
uniref:non-specific serine/threonine protein kinase n=1 Tax=Acanthochromis polyacanthus TaxID=80966 RepID=A0A3Q1EYZ1_9TELE